MALTATYTQVNSQSDKWIGVFTTGGKYYAIRESYGALYEILNGSTNYKRNLGAGAVWGGYDCDGSYIYVLKSTNISKMDPGTGSVPSSSSIGSLRSIGIDTANGRVFAITNAGDLYVFTTNNMTASYVTNLGAATYGPKMVYLNGSLYLPVYGGQIKKYVVGGALTTLSNVSPLGWLSFSTDGTYIYGTVDNGYIYRIDPTDATPMEVLSGDSTGRYWYTNTYVNGELWAATYNGYCYKITLPPATSPPATPTSSISTSTIYQDTSVTLSCSTSGATIKYTTDGTTPGLSNGTTYSAPFTISATTTIKFCAIKDGYVTAGVDSALTIYKGVVGTYIKKLVLGSNSSYKMQICHDGANMYLMYNAQVYKYNGSTFDYLYTPSETPAAIAASDTYIWTGGINFVYRRTIVGGTTVSFNYGGSNRGWGALCYSSSIFGVGSGSNYYYTGATGTGTPSTLTGLGSGWNYAYQMCKIGSNYYATQSSGTTGINKITGTVVTEQLNTYTAPVNNRIYGIATDGTYLFFAVDSGYVYMQDLSSGAILRVFGDIARKWKSLSYDTVNNVLYGLYRDTNGDDCLASIAVTKFQTKTAYSYNGTQWKPINDLNVSNGSTWKSYKNVYQYDSCDIWTKIPLADK